MVLYGLPRFKGSFGGFGEERKIYKNSPDTFYKGLEPPTVDPIKNSYRLL